MADADLYRIQQLPSDPLGGGSGEKRKFALEFIGKTPNEHFPYTVANEVVASYLGSVLGFNVPWVIPHVIEGTHWAMVLWMKTAAREQKGPPLTSKAMKEFVLAHDFEIHGAIILDLFVGNSDRSFGGGERRNIAVDEQGKLLLFDFGNALYYRPRPHVGIEAGVPRLQQLANGLHHMFDKPEENADNYYFELLTNATLVEEWCERIRQLPDYVIESAVARIPNEVEPPTHEERRALVAFLKERRGYLREHIFACQDKFPSLAGEK